MGPRKEPKITFVQLQAADGFSGFWVQCPTQTQEK